jgi:Na+-translocating ferredoxin:NAD+ oxidoreductase RNF subunit RnfB
MSAISRRDLFRSVFGRKTEPVAPPVATPAIDETPQLALILDRFCLAYQGSFCSVCSERCPELGAIVVTQGKPRVNPDFCTGCKICHDVCPAPKNAVFLVARKPRQGMIGRTVCETEPPPAENTD